MLKVTPTVTLTVPTTLTPTLTTLLQPPKKRTKFALDTQRGGVKSVTAVPTRAEKWAASGRAPGEHEALVAGLAAAGLTPGMCVCVCGRV